MKIISVNVGLPRETLWRGMNVLSSIFKNPVPGPVSVKALNLDGDRQADLTVHGGPNKAVYAYPIEHYPYWKRELQIADLAWGAFGENLTVEGVTEDVLAIGDQLKTGSAVLTVTQPRSPCYKLAMKFGRDDMIEKFLNSRRSGIYFSVAQEGEVGPGDSVEILSRDPHHVTIADINRLYVEEHTDEDLLNRALETGALPQSWKDYLARRAAARRR